MFTLGRNRETVSLYFTLAIIIVLPNFMNSMSSHECASRSGSSEHCVCSLSRAVDSIIAIVKGSQIESKLESFRCSEFIQLPSSLTKAEEYAVVPEEHHGQAHVHERSRKHRSDEDSELDEEYQDTINDIEEAPAPEYEHPRYSVDKHGRRTGPRIRRFRREALFHYTPPQIQNHHRSKRQVAMGVPTKDTFSKVVANMPSPRELHQYVPLGSPATLQCYNLEKNPHFRKWPNKRFTWTYFDGRPVTTSQMTVDKKTGTLTIYAVQLQDTDVYNCTVDFVNKNSEIEMTEKFSHQIDVVSEPAFWLKMSVYYVTDSDSCFPEEIYDIEKSITPWIHAYACENCEVRNISVMCHHSEGVTKILLQMIITTMGMESKIPSLKFGTSYSCPLTCSEKLHLKLLGIVDVSLAKMFLLPIELIDVDGESIWYEPVKSSMTSEIMEGCLSGFYQAYKLCFPCAIGKYSPNGKSDCTSCPKGSFQNKQGSSGCIQCATGLSTLSEGSTTEFSCIIPTVFDGTINWIQIHWILAILIFLLISTVLKIVIFLWCFPQSKVTLIIRMILLCGGCFNDCCDCCANCVKRPVMHKKSSKQLKRGSSLLLTTDTTNNTDDDTSSDSDEAEKVSKPPKRTMKAKLTSLGKKAANKLIPKSAKSESNLNGTVNATSRLLPPIPEDISEDDEDDNQHDHSMSLTKVKTLPEKNAANDGVIKQLKGIKNVKNNLRSKMRRNDVFTV